MSFMQKMIMLDTKITVLMAVYNGAKNTILMKKEKKQYLKI